MIAADAFMLCLRWQGEFVGQFEDEPSTYIYEISGKIVALDNDEDAAAGRFALTYVDIEGVINAGEGLFLLMDATSQSLHEYSVALLDPHTYYFKRAVQRAVGVRDDFGGNLLLLDQLELLPKYRGMGLGLKLIREIIRRFHHGAGLVAMKPFPLQFEPRPDNDPERMERWKALDLDAMPNDKESATRKLMNYYSRLGFRRVAATPYMVLSPDIFETP